MTLFRTRFVLAAALVGCTPPADGEPTASDDGSSSGSTSADPATSAMTTMLATSAGTGSDASSSSDGDPSSSGSDDGGVIEPGTSLVVGTFTIPAGARVEEFAFDATGIAGAPAGTLVAVRIRDLTHPNRDQTKLCPASHPLDGCATVDYGAFGMTHDNHILYESPDGAAELHLYKDRSLQAESEPLLPNE